MTTETKKPVNFQELLEQIKSNPDRPISNQEGIWIAAEGINNLTKKLEELTTRVATLEIKAANLDLRTVGQVRLGNSFE